MSSPSGATGGKSSVVEFPGARPSASKDDPLVPLALDEFTAQLAVELDLDSTILTPATDFQDLGFDSLAKIDVVVAVERLGAYLPDEAAAMFGTVEELHRFYMMFLGRDVSPIPRRDS